MLASVNEYARVEDDDAPANMANYKKDMGKIGDNKGHPRRINEMIGKLTAMGTIRQGLKLTRV